MAGSMDMIMGLGNMMGSMASSIGTSIGGLLALIGNAQRYGEGQGIINAQYAPTMNDPATGAIIPGSGGPAADYRNFLHIAADRLGQGGDLDFGALGRDIAGAGQQMRDDLLPQWRDRWLRNMQYLEGAGQQERRDINTQFDNAGAAQQADLTSRGLAGTTVLPSMQAGTERQRSDALGALDERLRQQKISTDAGLSADYLNANQGLWQNMLAMRQMGYGIGQTGLQNELALRGGLNQSFEEEMMTRLNLLTGVQNPYPSQANNLNLSYQAGLGSWPAPNYPRANSGGAFAQGLGGSALAGATAGLILA